MVKLWLMASHGPVFQPDQLGFSRFSKDCQTSWPNHGPKHELPDTFNLRLHQSEEPWKPIGGFPEVAQFVEIESTIRKPVLIDVQDTNPNSTLFSYGIAEQCTRHEKILQFLMSSSKDTERAGVDLSILTELMGLQALTVQYTHHTPNALYYGSSAIKDIEVQPSIICPPSIELNDKGPLLDVVGDLVQRSEISLNQDGRVVFKGTGAELKDILSVIAEYYLVNNSTKWRKQSVLIPHFNSEATAIIQEPTMVLENVKFAPLKSPRKIEVRPSPKKKANKKGRERDLYERNYFHACETLLTLIVEKNRNKKTTIHSLKKSGPELPQLLTRFSASIAGTGLAVLFSVLCKVAYSRVPFCSSKLFETGIGLGLVWLSRAVNRLRDTVVYISKNSGKMRAQEKEMMWKLDKCVQDMFFRGIALMAVAVLRLA